MTARLAALTLVCLQLAGCYESHVASDAAPFDAGPRPAPGAYAMQFAPEPPGGTALSLTDDVLSSPIPIGFPFRFFDTRHTSLVVSSNGFITFDDTVTNSGCCSGRTIPTPDDIDGIVAYAWTDLFPPGGGSLTHETRGTAPNRRFVLTATNQSWCCSMGMPQVTTQLILREGSDFIEIHTTRQGAGHTYTQGVEDEDGRRAFFLPRRVASDFALTNDAVLFVTY